MNDLINILKPGGKWFGVWTDEEAKDTLVMATVVATGTFIATIIYRAVDKWLKETRW